MVFRNSYFNIIVIFRVLNIIMINLIFAFLFSIALVCLLIQRRKNKAQRDLIKKESKALKRLQKNNSQLDLKVGLQPKLQFRKKSKLAGKV